MRHASGYCIAVLSLYLNVDGLRQGPGETFWRSWKILEFFVSKSVGTLRYIFL